LILAFQNDRKIHKKIYFKQKKIKFKRSLSDLKVGWSIFTMLSSLWHFLLLEFNRKERTGVGDVSDDSLHWQLWQWQTI